MTPGDDWARRLHYLEPGGEGADLLLASPPRLLRTTLYVLGALLVAGFVWAWVSKVDIYITARGAVRPDGDLARIQASAGGRITSVRVTDGQAVRAGDVLFVLDQRETETGLDQLENQLRGVEQRLEALRRNSFSLAGQHRAQAASDRIATENAQVGVALAREEERARAADLDKAIEMLEATRLDTERKQRLFRENVISEADRRAAETQLRVGQSTERSARADLAASRQAVAAAQKAYELAVQRAEVQARQRQQEAEDLASELVALEAQKRTLELDREKLRTGLDQLEIRAPVSGTVTTVGARSVGEVAQPGMLMATIAPANARWIVEAWVPQVDAGPLREKVGARVHLKLDAFPFRDYGTLEGRLSEVAPDADFSNPVTPTYRVKIALASLELGRGRRQGQVRLGMAASAEIVKEEERILLLLFRSVRDRVSYE